MKPSVNRITILNIVSTFLLQGIAFLTTPVFSRLLGTTQYGIYSLFNSWVLILTCLMGLSMSSSIGTGIYTFKERYVSFRNSILLSSSIISLIELSVIIIFSPLISYVTAFSVDLVILIGITAFAHYIVNFAQLSFIYEKKAGKNVILSASLSLFSVLLSVFLIFNMDSSFRYLGRIYGVAITYSITAIVFWLLLFVSRPTAVHSEYLKYGIVVGFPIVFHSLSQQILGQSDRVMMQAFGLEKAEIGIYSLFYTLSSVLSTILGALNNSWCPFYYDDISKENWSILDKKSKNYIELFTVLGIGFILLSREVSYLMADESYRSGIEVIPILALAVYFTFMYQFPVNFEFFHKKTKIIAIGTVGAGVLNILLNALMIPLWGMYGAAIATALSYLALFFAHYYIVTHMKEYSYHLSMKIFVPGVLGMCVCTILFYVLRDWWYVRWGLGAFLGVVELYRVFKRKSVF